MSQYTGHTDLVTTSHIGHRCQLFGNTMTEQKKPWSQQTTEERLDVVIRHYQRFGNTMTEQKKPWSQQTTEERLNVVIRHYQRALTRIDHDGTALTHDTYLNDKVRYSTAQDYQEFLQALHSIKENP